MWQKIKSLFSSNHNGILKDRCILLVDDGHGERHVVKRILEKQGCRVLSAENGRIGLHLAETEGPDLIILDCFMPGMLGPEVCERLKKSEKTKDIPVVFLTGSETPANIVNCYDVGAVEFLAKPVSAKVLIAHIKRILEEAQF